MDDLLISLPQKSFQPRPDSCAFGGFLGLILFWPIFCLLLDLHAAASWHLKLLLSFVAVT